MAAQHDERPTMKRRGILAAAAAVLAGIAAKQAVQPVAALDVSIAEQFQGQHATGLPHFASANGPGGASSFYASGTSDVGFLASGTFLKGVSGHGSTYGVQGQSDSGTGVYGLNTSGGIGVDGQATGGIGVHGADTGGGYGVSGTSSGVLPAVYGANVNNANSIGVQGFTRNAGIGVLGGSKGDTFAANGIGVRGLTDNGNALEGRAGAGNSVFAASDTGYGVYATAGGIFPAIRGENSSNSNGVIGVFGYASGSGSGIGVLGSTSSGTGVNGLSSGGAGVSGFSSTGNGVLGQSSTGYGVLGYSTGGSASLSGISTNANIPAFAGGNSVAGGLAAVFAGTVFVNGMFVVADMTQKHGLLKHPDGSHRLMYTVEAPKSWAEDFGTGTLAGGKAEVKLDPDFAALIHTEDYHVFLTEHGGHNGLHTTAKGATGFTVAAAAHVTKAAGIALDQAAGTFSWRVVAKPKSDKKVERLGKFAVPNIPLPDVSKLPKPETPQVPKKP